MKPDLSEFQSVYIHPGEAYFSSKPIVVSTILGSCLSITMFSSKLKFAGISHCVLPNNKDCNSDCNNCITPFRYVDCTIVQMLKKFKIQSNDIEVKIFGGADVLKNSSKKGRISTVGRQNIKMAKETLEKNNIYISSFDVGGEFGRKIYFLTETGEVFLNRLKNNE